MKAFYHYVKLKLFREGPGRWSYSREISSFQIQSGTHDKANHPSFGTFRRFISSQLVVKFKSSIAEVHKTVYWTDAMTALCWIKNQRIWKQYVQHRVDEICSLTPKEAWRHCPGHLNPADLPLHGLTAKVLVTCETVFIIYNIQYL